MDLHVGRLRELEHGVVVEVALHHPPALDADLPVQRGGEAVHDGALDLGLDRVRIHHDPAVHGAHDAVHSNSCAPCAGCAPCAHGHLRHLRQIRLAKLPERDATMAPGGRRRAPARALRRQVEHGQQPGMPGYQLAAVLVGILACRMGQFIQEAFDYEAVLRRAHAPPRGDGNAGVLGHALQAEIGNGIDQLVRPPGDHERCADGPHQPVAPRHRNAARVQSGTEHVVRGRSVEAVLDVVLAGPHHLHRRIELLRQLHRLGAVIHRPTSAPKTSAQIRHVHGDRRERQAGDPRRLSLNPLGRLGRRPDLAASAAHVRRAVHGLHARVRQIEQYDWPVAYVSRREASQFVPPPPTTGDAALSIGDMIRLRGFHAAGPLEPSATVPVIVEWEVLREIRAGQIQSFVQLINTATWTASGSSNDQYILRYLYPADMWQPGDIVPDVYFVTLSPDLPDGVYLWASGAYLPSRPSRLPIRIVGGLTGPVQDVLFAEVARIPPPSIGLPPPYDVARVEGQFADGIALEGYRLIEGDSLTLELYWRAVGRPAGDYTIFVHVMNGETLLAQADARPQDGALPTWAWLPGELVVTTHTLAVPGGTDNIGAIYVGMYTFPSLERLPIEHNGIMVEDGRLLLWAAPDR